MGKDRRKIFRWLWVFWIVTGPWLVPSIASARSYPDRSAVMWEVQEWRVANPSWSGNPYGVVAKVTFEHQGSGAKRTTEMFYDGGDTWKFRFTGTRTGTWTFRTSSEDEDLDGHSGTVTVAENSDPEVRGFITHQGNQFARQVNGPDDLQGFLPNTYMNQVEFGNPEGCGWTDISPTLTDADTLNAYLDEVEKMGMNGVFFHVIHQWFKAHSQGWDDHDSVNPDRKTFAALEKLIVKAHRRGLYVHLWAWGDEARKWTPIGLEGGINGKVDRRLQRYIAARLGPLPGWVMGYGFDLEEWVNEEQLANWAGYLHERMGWPHMLWARGREAAELDAISISDSGIRSCDEIVRDLDADPSRPDLYEERDTYLRSDELDMTGTRRFLWRQSVAGGMMGFWGNYPKSCGAYGGDHPYPNPELLRTHDRFWNEENRFRLDLERANDLADGFGLKDDAGEHYVLYKEGTSSIKVDLSGAARKLPAIAVDTAKPYREIGLGILEASAQTIELPGKSDWAIAIGEFEKR